MRILMVLDHPYPPDLRVENEARTLVGSGFEVAVLSIAPRRSEAALGTADGPSSKTQLGHLETERTAEGVLILRDVVPAKAVNWMRGLSGTLSLPSRLLARRIRRAASLWPFDVLHVHDLYLGGGGVRAARKMDCPLVVDLHENWVEVLNDYRWSSGFPMRWVVGRRRWVRKERRWLAASDLIVTVSDELTEAVRSRAGLQGAAMITVPNTVSLQGFGAEAVDTQLAQSLGKQPVVMYAGGLVDNRGLDTAVAAWPAVLDAVPGARLLILGAGVSRGELEAQVRGLGIAEQVDFLGHRPVAEIPTYIAGSAVCINPLRRTPQTDVALSHKIYQYMLGGRPIVVSDCPPMKRLVEQTGGGIAFTAGDPVDMAKALIELLSSPEKAREMGRRGREAVLRELNWETTSKPLVAAYRQLKVD